MREIIAALDEAFQREELVALSTVVELRQVLETPAAYVGMIGSQRKVSVVFDHLRSEGMSEERLAHIHAPIGLDLGGRSPAEIALAILAEIVQVRYGGTGQPRALQVLLSEESDEESS